MATAAASRRRVGPRVCRRPSGAVREPDDIVVIVLFCGSDTPAVHQVCYNGCSPRWW